MTVMLHDVFSGEAGASLFRLAGRTSARTLARCAQEAGWHFMRFDGMQVASKAGFLAAAGQVMRFPAWAGRNWDAFEELVNDLSWLPPAEGHLVLFERVDWLAQAQPRVLAVAFDILATAAENRRAAGAAPLVAVVRGAGAAAAGLPLLIAGR